MPFAQSSVTGTLPSWLIVVIVVVPASLLFVFMLTTVLLRHFRTNRTLLHTERARSIDAGLPIDVSEQTKLHAKYMRNAFCISLWLTFGVPIAAFFAAAAATRVIGHSGGLVIAVWVCAAVASTAAVICATVLMINSGCRLAKVTCEAPQPAKP